MNGRWAGLALSMGLLLPALAAGEETREPRVVGRTRQEWVNELEAGSRRQRSHSAWAISQLAVQQAGPQDTMLWLNELYLLSESDSPAVRYWGLTGLGQFLDKIDADHPARATAVQVLADALNDRSLGARLAAAEALVHAGRRRQGLFMLTEAMKSPHDSVRIQAVAALERLGERALPARATLQQAAGDSSEYVKRISSRALKRLEGK